MGTNYYIENQPPCVCCGRPYEEKHIGKSSAGWCFALHVYPEEGINNLEDWKKYWIGKPIKDEYGAEISHAKMLQIITKRTWGREEDLPNGYRSWAVFDEKNYSMAGPNGLRRSQTDGHHCIGHGKGTWDLIVGEFS